VEVQGVTGKLKSGTYADVEVVVHQRLRVAFNEETKKSEIMRKLRTGDFYDITDEETYKYEALIGVEWLGDDLDESE
jgi:hypothetical protein